MCAQRKRIRSVWSGSSLDVLAPVTAVQRMRLGTTNAAEILLTGKRCKCNVSFILTEISRDSFSGGYGITTGCVLVVLSKFQVMTQSEKEKQSYKLGHNRQNFKDLSIKDKWHVHGHSRGFHVSRYRGKCTVFYNSVSVFGFQIFNAARQLSHTEAALDKSGLVLLDYWVGLKRCLVIIHN